MIGGSPNPAGLLGQANVAVDSSTGPTRGNVYVGASVSSADPADVTFIRSTDGGATWSAPVRVNDDASQSELAVVRGALRRAATAGST